jgi:hypothetical protein
VKLATLSEFRKHIFTPESAPSLSTLRRWVDRGALAGGRVTAGKYFVDLDKWDTEEADRRELVERMQKLAKSSVLKGLI